MSLSRGGLSCEGSVVGRGTTRIKEKGEAGVRSGKERGNDPCGSRRAKVAMPFPWGPAAEEHKVVLSTGVPLRERGG